MDLELKGKVLIGVGVFIFLVVVGLAYGPKAVVVFGVLLAGVCMVMFGIAFGGIVLAVVLVSLGFAFLHDTSPIIVNEKTDYEIVPVKPEG